MEAAARLCGVVASRDVMAGRTARVKKKEIRQEKSVIFA